MKDNYKARKEAFVSNHNGGPVWEILLVTLVLQVSPKLQLFVKAIVVDISARNPALVRPPVSNTIFCSILDRTMSGRLPSQRVRDSICNDRLL